MNTRGSAWLGQVRVLGADWELKTEPGDPMITDPNYELNPDYSNPQGPYTMPDPPESVDPNPGHMMPTPAPDPNPGMVRSPADWDDPGAMDPALSPPDALEEIPLEEIATGVGGFSPRVYRTRGLGVQIIASRSFF